MFSFDTPEIMFPKYERNYINCDRPENKWDMKDKGI